MSYPTGLKIKLFADGAEKQTMLTLYGNPIVRGFTTNPTLMRQAGIRDYEGFARDILAAIPDRPISFEVFADEFDEMEQQARYIAKWGENVYVKIPVTNTKRQPSSPLVHKLSQDGIKLNVTAVLTPDQVQRMATALDGGAPAYISIFAGRIADTGRDPVSTIETALSIVSASANIEIIWASPRELLNVFQANAIGCHVITATSDIIKKLSLVGKDLEDYSLETVTMFRNDALNSNFKIDVRSFDEMAVTA